MRAFVAALSRWLPVLAVALVLFWLTPAVAAKREAARVAAATEHPLATRTALDVLAQGGNAVDAMIAAVFVAGVVNPVSSGIGGGGFALVYQPGALAPSVLDFRETAPRGLDPVRFEQAESPDQRGQLVGVPGEVAGLYELSRRFGKLPFARLVAPAERLARGGFPVGAHLARSLGERSAAAIQRDPTLRALYYPGGRALGAGQVLRNPKLANTLRRVAAEGPAAIYEGVIAAEIAATAQSLGGALAIDDLRAYQVKERVPLRGEWAGHTIFTMPPPSAGGILLLQTLGMMRVEELRKLGLGSGAYQHILAEVFRSTIADRLAQVGDPDRAPVDVARLLDPGYLTQKKRRLAYDRTHTVPLFASREGGTHHLIVVDGAGMTVSLTTTVNRTFGAKLVAPESGIVLNDELADFTPVSETQPLGITDPPNAPRPLVRPVSSMTPTIAVRDGRVVLAIGGSGGPAIPTNVTQLFLAHFAFGKQPEELVKMPRFYVTPRTPTLIVEPGASKALLDDLAFRGEDVMVRALTTGVQVVAREGDTLRAAADPRKFGGAEVR